jgi:excinuclease ABC subunit C
MIQKSNEYNTLMKNEQNYCYIKIPDEQYPKVTRVKEKADDGALYFGPFSSRHRVETAIQYLNDFYPIRKCSSPRITKKANGCLVQQLGTCLGVCTGQVSPEEYGIYVEKIRQLLNGQDKKAVLEISIQLEKAVNQLEFEKAARYRGYFLALRYVIGKQNLIQSSGKNKNILAVEWIASGIAKFFFIKGNKLLRTFVLNIGERDSSGLEHWLKPMIKETFLNKTASKMPLTQRDIDEAQIIDAYLKRNKNRIMSFWIPSARLRKETDLDAIIAKIVAKMIAVR